MANAALKSAPEGGSSVQRASLIAALFLLLRELVPTWTGWPSTVAGILAIVGAGKSQTYAMVDRLRSFLPTLLGTPGRPRSVSVEESTRLGVVDAAYAFVVEHAGAITNAGERRAYSDGFRRFVIGLVARGQPAHGVSVTELASMVRVPLGTLKEWLHPKQSADVSSQVPSEPTEPDTDDGDVPPTIRDTHLRLIARLWKTWTGTFLAFCQMLRTEYRLNRSMSFIANFLEGAGLRKRHRRRPVEAPWSSGTFRKMFPGAQWIGDGTSIAVKWGDHIFVFNVETIMDAATDASMGFTVSDTENEEALCLAYLAALETTVGQPPVSLLLDNRSSNHSPGAEAATPGTILVPSTPGRGQSKAPVEGGFGLFSQAFPELRVPAGPPREQARSFVHQVLTAWHVGRNGKPRRRLDNRSPAQAYGEYAPTKEETRAAVAWAEELQRRNELARRTREARCDPVRLELLKRGLEELGIADPDHRLAIALACYDRDAIVRGLAILRAKQERKTLPEGADPGRYLGGIIRQTHTQLEQELIADYLLEQRIRLRDLSLEPLNAEADRIRRELTPDAVPAAFILHALEATWMIDFRFWGKAAAQALLALPTGNREPHYRDLSKKIIKSFKTDRDRRQDLLDWLAAVTVLP